MQVVMSPTCLEVQDLAWTVSLFTGNVHNITLNMQLSWRSIKLTDLDIYQTSLPYFGVKLSCVCLMFADRKK